ncbi:MOSC domain-containing protein [Neobacillus sp. SM06]|uniref:MOSC domain-containing protein n=1 Tax=Neobacillus sp. SM06 TaxID=3422492 RepID=UPI003D29B114
MTTPEIVNLAVGKPREFVWGKNIERSGIGKQTVFSAELKKDGFIGDGVENVEFHGGVDRAVCFYPFEHYSFWNKQFGKLLTPPALGENITASGLMEKDVCIGDIFQIGTAVIQVTQGRIPCLTISKFNFEENFLNRLVETGYTGYFLRVLEEGRINADSKIEWLEKEPNRVSVLFANHILFHDQKNTAGVEKILSVEALADVWRQKLLKLL